MQEVSAEVHARSSCKKFVQEASARSSCKWYMHEVRTGSSCNYNEAFSSISCTLSNGTSSINCTLALANWFRTSFTFWQTQQAEVAKRWVQLKRKDLVDASKKEVMAKLEGTTFAKIFCRHSRSRPRGSNQK